MADQCEDRDERIECAVPLEPCQKQYGRRFEQPYSDSTAFDGDCGLCGVDCAGGVRCQRPVWTGPKERHGIGTHLDQARGA